MIRSKRRDANFIIGCVLTGLVLLLVLAGLIHTPFDPNAMNASAKNLGPTLTHLFGTDNYGRDVLSRVMQGAGTTFLIAVSTVAIGAGIGTVVGLITGWYGGVLDEVLMRLNDILAAFPSILLALVLIAVIGPGTANVVLALGLIFIPSFARIARASCVVQKQLDYVKNARTMGAKPFRIMFRHILPNMANVLLTSLGVGFNNAVLAEAGMSFLGLGVQPPDPSLGRMLADAQSYLLKNPWNAIFPGLVIVCTVLGVSLMGEGSIPSAPGSAKRANRSARKKTPMVNAAGPVAAADPPVVSDSVTAEDSAAAAGSAAAADPSAAVSTVTAADTAAPLIRVSGLSLSLPYSGKELVHNISFSIGAGERVGLVGESGSGKTLSALSIIGLLPETVTVSSGSIVYADRELTACTEEERRKLRGSGIAMIFQEPMTSLNPVYPVGHQVAEMVRLHEEYFTKTGREQRADHASGNADLEQHHSAGRVSPGSAEIHDIVTTALKDAGLPDAEALYGRYPHELSGGQRQRVMIAMAMVCRPKLLIADEPTTALDITIQAQILELIRHLNETCGTAVLLISHDLGVVRHLCSRVLVMDGGKIVESGQTEEVFRAPKEAYTKKLLAAVPAVGRRKLPLPDSQPSQTAQQAPQPSLLLTADHLTRSYVKRGFFGKKTAKQALYGVSFSLKRNEILGIVGESGCGKSTLARLLAGLEAPDSGSLTKLSGKIGLVFQDPYSSLNPAKSIRWILEEPLKIAGGYTKAQRREAVLAMEKQVGLPPERDSERVSSLSGGQRQRVAIACALMERPQLLILDEPVSALDVTIQDQILDLCAFLKQELGLTMIFISHDLNVIYQICDRVIVMKDGRIVESGPVEQVYYHPQSDYAKQLIAAIPRL